MNKWRGRVNNTIVHLSYEDPQRIIRCWMRSHTLRSYYRGLLMGVLWDSTTPKLIRSYYNMQISIPKINLTKSPRIQNTVNHRRIDFGGRGSPGTWPPIIEKRPCIYRFLQLFAPPIFWFAHPIFLTSLHGGRLHQCTHPTPGYSANVSKGEVYCTCAVWRTLKCCSSQNIVIGQSPNTLTAWNKQLYCQCIGYTP